MAVAPKRAPALAKKIQRKEMYSIDEIAGDAIDSAELSKCFCTYAVLYLAANYYLIKWKLQAQKT